MTYSRDFLRALSVTLAAEGGYSNRHLTDDPGGELFMGISRVAHPAAWRSGRPSVAAVVQIYHDLYWQRIRGDELPWPVNLVVFDFCVPSGGAVRAVQSALKLVPDGVVGQKTVAALAMAAASEEKVAMLNIARLRYFQGLANWEANANGWIKRVLMVQGEAARAFPAVKPFPVPEFVTGGEI